MERFQSIPVWVLRLVAFLVVMLLLLIFADTSWAQDMPAFPDVTSASGETPDDRIIRILVWLVAAAWIIAVAAIGGIWARDKLYREEVDKHAATRERYAEKQAEGMLMLKGTLELMQSLAGDSQASKEMLASLKLRMEDYLRDSREFQKELRQAWRDLT